MIGTVFSHYVETEAVVCVAAKICEYVLGGTGIQGVADAGKNPPPYRWGFRYCVCSVTTHYALLQDIQRDVSGKGQS